MKVFLVDNGTTLLEKLQKLIPGEEEVVCFDSFDSAAAQDADLVVLSGSSIGPLYGNEDKYKEEIEFIKNTDKPIFGICFGCELIVHAFGGTLKKLDEHEHGEVLVSVVDNKELFCGKDSFTAFENHRWGIDVLPEGFSTLAESEHGPEVIVDRKRNMYGIQYHPENQVEEHEADEVFLHMFESVVRGI
ncbi:MAG: type 1 glutamine amidotransferase [Patescibacteria group bacterium UBA2103]